MPNPNIPFPLTEGWTTTMNIYAKVGLVTLMGLIAKNGILIVDFANKLQLEGMPKLAAVREAALIRLRPILMTTAATIAGHLPLVFVTGAGAAARNSIGLVLVGGMTVGTLFTIFVVPAIYMLIARDHAHDREAEQAAAATGADSGDHPPKSLPAALKSDASTWDEPPAGRCWRVGKRQGRL